MSARAFSIYALLRRGRFFSAVFLALAVMSTPAVAQTTLYVRSSISGGSDNNTCTPTTATDAFNNALETLGKAEQCAVNATTDVTIIVLCEPSGGCVHQSKPSMGASTLPVDNIFHANANGRSITLRAEPLREVSVEVPYSEINPKHKGIIFHSNWTVRGFTFVGSGSVGSPVPNDATNSGTFIQLNGSNIHFEHNEVRSTPYSCVGVRQASTGAQSTGVEIKHNLIHDCKDAEGVRDRHCVSTEDARDLTVAYNDIYNCSGDAFQVTNCLPGTGGSPPSCLMSYHPTSSMNVRIIGNRMFTEGCVKTPAGNKRTFGENGIDIKRAGRGLIIRDNLIWGFRAYNSTWSTGSGLDPVVDCMGTGDGGSFGDGIVLHGQLDEANNGSQCTTPPCGIIEGNDISDSASGISVSGTIGQGNALGVWVRGNYIHDLRGNALNGNPSNPNAPNYYPNERKGFALSLATPASPPPGNRVYRNTIVNIPGRSIYTGTFGGSTAFTLRNNLFQNLAGCSPPPSGLDYGMNTTPAANYFYNAPPSSWTGTAPIVFRGTTGPILSPSLACGDQGAGLPAKPHKYTGLPYDYRLSITSSPPSGQFLDRGGTSADFGDRHTEMEGFYGAEHDKSADEYQTAQSTRVVYLRDGSPTDPAAADEEYSGANWWESPDIGLLKGGSAAREYGTQPPHALHTWPDSSELPHSNPVFTKTPSPLKTLEDTWILVRVLHDQNASTIAANSDIHIRVWGAPWHTELAFPTTFTAYVDMVVPWDGGTVGTDASGNVIWKVMKQSPTAHIYAFPWKMLASKHPKVWQVGNLEHFCIRAWASAPDDRRAPFFLPVNRSNNMAQRNIWIEHQGLATGAYLAYIEATDRQDGERTILIDNRTHRPVFFYEPRSTADIWTDNDEEPFPPREGRLIHLDDGKNKVRVKLAATQLKAWQLLVDSRELGPPEPGEHISVRQGAGGFTIVLNTPGFRESFEWGIPESWTATGLWRVTDQFEACGSSRTGRKAAGFYDPRNCVLKERASAQTAGLNKANGQKFKGRLISPSFIVSEGPGQIRFSFYEWAKSTHARRSVAVAVNGGKFRPIATWRKDHGAPDEWIYQYADISKYKGARLRVAFTIAGPARYSQDWFIDDLEVEAL